MKNIRAKIIIFWLLFLLFCLLLGFSWRHRLLWLSIFVPGWVIMGLIGPRVRRPGRSVSLLFGLGFILFAVTAYVHGLHPSSPRLSMLAKVASLALVAPMLGYKMYVDYCGFRTVGRASVEPGCAADRSQPFRPGPNHASAAAVPDPACPASGGQYDTRRN
jgi:hypothetical protein